MSVHYKFKSALKYDTITFDGLHISVKDLKRDILQQKQIGKTGDFDLQITNAQTNEVYLDETTLIPKNSSLIVVRVPLTAQQKRAWDRQEANQQFAGLKHVNTNIPTFVEGQDPAVQKLAKAVDLSSIDASEDDKIMAMMTQSTLDYDPINYARIRGTTQVGEVPPNYRCYKCHQPGHWIKDCRLGINQENQPEIRKSTGIPRSFMVPVDGPSVPGAMMTPSGQFAVPSIDHQAYLEGKKPSLPPEEMAEKPAIPEELVCSICHDLLTDTVMIPCCGSSFCDECIRTVLLESENHQCPDCKEIGISPDTMIPNRYLRKQVDNFRNMTGYQRTLPSRTPVLLPVPGNSLVPVPMAQPIMALGGRSARPMEVINLIESRSDTDSPDNHNPPPSNRLPYHKPNVISSTNSILPSKGGDIGRGPSQDSGRMQYSQPDRSATPTIDERSITTSLPDTSVPPPVATYAITALGGNSQSNYGGPHPNYGAPPSSYPRAPLPYPNLGPGPNYPPVESRGNIRPGYRPYLRGSRGGGRISSGYRDLSDRNNSSSQIRNIEDPLVAFEKILREKDLARERNRRRKRSFSRSPSPRPRSRTRSPLPHRKRGSVSPSPPARQPRSRTRSPSPPLRARSRTPSPLPRSKPRTTRSHTRSPPMKRRSPSFTISRSRSRSFSRTPSPRDRHFSPRRRDDARFRSPLQGRNSPQRYHGRNYKEYEGGQYYERSRGRPRGYIRGRGGDSNYYTNSPARYDGRYEDRSSRGYHQQPPPSRVETTSQLARYSNRRYDNYGDTVPPGTEPVYDRYGDDYNERRVVVTIPSENRESREAKREREVRDAAARDWERTRDRELEQREKERQRDYVEEYHRSSYRKSTSPSKSRKRSSEITHERGKENKQHSGEAIEAISIRDQNLDPSYKGVVEVVRARVPVLIDLKKEPSMEKEKKKEESTVPSKERDKKKDKDKKKKKREEGEKKEKKKKRKEKKEGMLKGKSEEKLIPLKTTEGKPIIIGLKGESAPVDPLYGDIEGTKVDKEVVQNYGKVELKPGEGESVETHSESTPGVKLNVVLAPVPELSKWELDEEVPSQDDRLSGDEGSSSADKKIVTSEVLKRAENAIFQKAINAIRPIDAVKKTVVLEKPPEKTKEKKEFKESVPKEQPVQEPVKVSTEATTESREARKVANSIQITIPSNPIKAPERSVEIAVAPVPVESSEPSKSRSRLDRSKIASVPVVPSSPVRVSAKERLGAKIENDKEEVRRVRSTVERKSRSKTPKRYFDRKYNDREKQREISPGGRRVVVSSNWPRDKEKEDSRKERRISESSKSMDKRNEKIHEKEKDRKRDKKSRSSSREKKHKKEVKTEKIVMRKRDDKHDERQVTVKMEQKKEGVDKKLRKNPRLSSDRKKSVIDEANFEPDYDESEPESEPEVPGEEKNLLVNVTVNQPSPTKKRSRSPSEIKENKKKIRSELEQRKSPEKLAKEKDSEKTKKIDPLSEETSESDSSSDTSSDSSVDRKKHKKKKKSKKRRKKKSKKRKNSSSDSDSSDSSSSDSDTGKKKKKHKHRKKSSKSKKRKKSKHK